MTTSTLSSSVGISESSWTKEKSFLLSCDLILQEKTRVIGEKGVVRKTSFTLTSRGRCVAQNLLSISTILGLNVTEPPVQPIYALNQRVLSAS